jgi:hypothetical protein
MKAQQGKRAHRLPALAAVAATAWVTGAQGVPPTEYALPAAQVAKADPGHPPLFAYFYAWFDRSSWNRAKKDYPLAGPYSSDDESVIHTQMRQARQAGIDVFIVSWKSTPVNNRRLRLLMRAATEEHMRLAIIYQGLDFHRNPLPVTTVLADFTLFRDTFAIDPVFARDHGRAITVWSGTWKFSAADVAHVTGAVRRDLAVLATEKNVAGYERLAALTDGDAYYWSSVQPGRNKNYAAKLQAMSKAVHAHQGYWIAPFAPGFDARDVGGTQIVDRRDGQTLRDEYATAMSSAPDALGLISWNEFSENTYVEPSHRYGDISLRILRDLRVTALPTPSSAADSSDSSAAAPPSTAVGAARGNGMSPVRSLLESDGGLTAVAVGLVALLLGLAAATRAALSRTRTRPRWRA